MSDNYVAIAIFAGCFGLINLGISNILHRIDTRFDRLETMLRWKEPGK